MVWAGVAECESKKLRLVGIDFRPQKPLPRVKTEDIFIVPRVANIDDIKLEEWFQDQGGNLSDCISFGWNIPLEGENLVLTFEDNQGAQGWTHTTGANRRSPCVFTVMLIMLESTIESSRHLTGFYPLLGPYLKRRRPVNGIQQAFSRPSLSQ